MEMDKTTIKTESKSINLKANTEARSEVIVDRLELKIIQDFIEFIRQRERGEYRIEIYTHNGVRSVLIDATDKKRFEI